MVSAGQTADNIGGFTQVVMRRPVTITINTLLALAIAGIILATWLPAIYTSRWFQTNHWIRVHVLHNSGG